MIDSFEFNKISGAVLSTLLFLMGLGIVSNALYTPHAPEKSAYALPEAAADAGKGAPAKKEVPIEALLAKADPAKGASAVKAACSACHTVDKGGAVKQGPNLYGVLGRKIAATPGYSYSKGMKAAGEKHNTWTFKSLAAFVNNPRKFASGTKMAYAGMKNQGRLADIVVYLRSLSEKPQPLPAAPKVEAAKPATKPAEKK